MQVCIFPMLSISGKNRHIYECAWPHSFTQCVIYLVCGSVVVVFGSLGSNMCTQNGGYFIQTFKDIPPRLSLICQYRETIRIYYTFATFPPMRYVRLHVHINVTTFAQNCYRNLLALYACSYPIPRHHLPALRCCTNWSTECFPNVQYSLVQLQLVFPECRNVSSRKKATIKQLDLSTQIFNLQ